MLDRLILTKWELNLDKNVGSYQEYGAICSLECLITNTLQYDRQQIN